MKEALFWMLLALDLWLVWLWYSQPEYEDGIYVPIPDRLCKIFVRVVGRGDSGQPFD